MSQESIDEVEVLNSELASIEELNVPPDEEPEEIEDPSPSDRYGPPPDNNTGNPNYIFEPRDTDSVKQGEHDCNDNENPMEIWYPNEYDPTSLAPTYSMVSFCPFLGKCCFFPMNFIPPHKCSTCYEEDVVKPKPVKKFITAPIPIALKEKPARTSLHNPPPPPIERKIKAIEPPPQGRFISTKTEVVKKEDKVVIRPKVEEKAVVRTKAEEKAVVRTKAEEKAVVRTKAEEKAVVRTKAEEKAVVRTKAEEKAVARPKVEEKAVVRTKVEDNAPVRPKVKDTAPVRPVVEETFREEHREDKTKYTEEISKEFDSHARGSKQEVRKRPSELLSSRQVVNSGIDMALIKKESLEAFKKEYKNLAPGIEGIKTLVNERSKTKTGLLDFVDYFTKKDGTKYIGMLEQYFIEFYEKAKSEVQYASRNNPSIAKKAEVAKQIISDTYRIVQVEDEKEIQEYDFPKLIEKDLKVFGINLSQKVAQIEKIHNYATQMVLFWVKQLDENKPIDPMSIYHTGTELMADIMVIIYSIYAKLADFFVQLVTQPTQKQVDVYTLEFFVKAFRNLVDGICDEIGSIGESCGQIMIRIQNLPRAKVVEVMTNLYKQVNYAHVSMSRAMESLAPAIQLFYVRFTLDRENNRKRILNARAEDYKSNEAARSPSGKRERTYHPQ